MTSIEPPSLPADDDVECVELRSGAGGPADARVATRRVLDRWRLPAAAIDDIVLAVSELVTNAIRYGRPPVELTVSRRHRDVRIDVHDDGVGSVTIPGPAAAASAQSGRGLAIVTAVADTVGCDITVDRPGKTMYATFLLSALTAATLIVRPS